MIKIKVSNDWLTHLAFSPWSLTERGQCESLMLSLCLGRCVGLLGVARLAYGTSSGGVGLVNVTQSLNLLP